MCKLEYKAVIQIEEAEGMPNHYEACVGETELKAAGVKNTFPFSRIYHTLVEQEGRRFLRPVVDSKKRGKLEFSNDSVELGILVRKAVPSVPQPGQKMRYWHGSIREDIKQVVAVVEDPDFEPVLIFHGDNRGTYDLVYLGDAYPLQRD